jgi:hypothetical protein
MLDREKDPVRGIREKRQNKSVTKNQNLRREASETSRTESRTASTNTEHCSDLETVQEEK